MEVLESIQKNAIPAKINNTTAMTTLFAIADLKNIITLKNSGSILPQV
jgi:hypothetical protein